MQVSLKVLEGSHAGRVIKLAMPEFVIGRKEGCHLRPRSDLISRKHCVISVGESTVSIRDLGSRNGTFVNDERIEAKQDLVLGDRVRVGKLEFLIMIDHSLGGMKKPMVNDIKEAAIRAAGHGEEEDRDVGSWLDEADEIAKERLDADPDTRQFRVDEVGLDSIDHPLDEEATETISGASAEDTTIETRDAEKGEPGKLPKPPSSDTKDSRDAAAQVLKDFFNRR